MFEDMKYTQQMQLGDTVQKTGGHVCSMPLQKARHVP